MYTTLYLRWFSLLAGLAFSTFSMQASADHSWGKYHWARTSSPFTLSLGDNVSPSWEPFLNSSALDWSASNMLDTTVAAGGANPKNCRPTKGRVEVCNSTYGNTGWLGIAQIWLSGSHITQAITKVNDTYFNTPSYNTPEWKTFVLCQEIGHTLGLDHQDVTFDNPNLGSCMDYTNNPAGPLSNEHPNTHDYAQLESIYWHFDSTNTVVQSASSTPSPGNASDANGPPWGRVVKTYADGRPSLYELDLGGRHKLLTFVIWTQEHGGQKHMGGH